MRNAVVDTNVLIDYPCVLDMYNVILPTAVLEELDGLKKDKQISYKVQSVIRKIEKTSVIFVVKDFYEAIPPGWDGDKRDNKIVLTARDEGCLLISNDINVRAKAASIGVEVTEFRPEYYSGVFEFRGDTEQVNDFYSNYNSYGLVENQYVIITNVDTGKTAEYRYTDGRLTRLFLPPAHVIKGLNSRQRCAIDLIYNVNIPIKIIAGCAGSGKTKIAVTLAVEGIKQGIYSKIVLIRNPIGSGEDVGFLPGGIEEKTDMFFEPIVDNLDGGELQLETLINYGQIEKRIPYHMKGKTLPHAFMLVDEAEDLDFKTLKMIGARIGKDGCVVFTGDYKQAEKKFLDNNGLIQLIEASKGNPLCGVVILDDDVRSDASKFFANI